MNKIIFDIGTTTIDAFFVFSYHNQKDVKKKTAMNCQRNFGHDVVSRMHSIERDRQNQKKMSVLLKEQCLSIIEEFYNESISEPQPFEVGQIIFIANTIEMHLLTNTDTSGMWKFPFKPKSHFNEVHRFADFFSDCFISLAFKGKTLFTNTSIFLPQCLDSFIGSDSLLGFYYCFSINKSPFCFIDIGTNAEIFLFDGKKVFYTSVAAGPAFERNLLHKGLNGTMIVEQTAHLKKRGILQSDGLLFAGLKNSTVILSAKNQKIVITQDIIRQIQLAKAAINAGIQTLFYEAKQDFRKAEHFFVSGAFGNGLNIENALDIGLFPKVDKSLFIGIDSSVFRGTELLLNNPDDFAYFMENTEFVHIDLAQNDFFEKEYIRSMQF